MKMLVTCPTKEDRKAHVCQLLCVGGGAMGMYVWVGVGV